MDENRIRIWKYMYFKTFQFEDKEQVYEFQSNMPLRNNKYIFPQYIYNSMYNSFNYSYLNVTVSGLHISFL